MSKVCTYMLTSCYCGQLSKVCTYNFCWQVVIVSRWASVLTTCTDKSLLCAVDQNLFYNICWQIIIVGSWAKSVLTTYADKCAIVGSCTKTVLTSFVDKLLLWAAEQRLCLPYLLTSCHCGQLSKVCTCNLCLQVIIVDSWTKYLHTSYTWQVVIFGSWAKSVLKTYADKLLVDGQSLYLQYELTNCYCG